MAKDKQCSSRLGKVGGQAVLEGVMMKSGDNIAVSVRRDDGKIVSDITKFESVKKRHKFLNVPIIRGVVNFVEMLSLSMKTLSKSAELSGMGDDFEESKFERWLRKKFGKGVLDFVMGLATVLGVALAVLIFFLAPNFLATQLGKWTGVSKVWEAVFASIIKILIFILYIKLVSLMKDIRRTFEYHGAEHKSIFCYESGEELTVENVKKQRRYHPRCGTSFMFVMLILGLIFALGARLLITYVIGFEIENNVLRALFYAGISLVILLPLIMGTGYEFLMYAGKHNNLFVRILSAPGLWMQRLTTREPDDKQIEVAIRSLKLAMPNDFPEDAAEYEKEKAEAIAAEKTEDKPKEPTENDPAGNGGNTSENEAE